VLVAAGLAAACGSASHASSTSPGGSPETVHVDGYSLTVKCSGATKRSPTVVLLAGLTQPLSTFTVIQGRLSSVTRVCSYDRPGEGASPRPRNKQTLADSARLLHDLLTSLDVAQHGIILVGHSLGGAVAAEYASRYRRSHEVKAVVLLDATPVGFASELKQLIPAGTTGIAGEVRSVNGAMASGDNPERLVLNAAPMRPIGSIPLTVVRHGQPIVATVPKYAQRLEAIWVQGERAWLHLSSRSRMVVARDSGHAIYLDQPVLTLQLIRAAISNATR
jgi:pimeloyl-ACP methyl ester carboxylesterase